jgi:ABC-type enterochelin transport system substrate-binding protein
MKNTIKKIKNLRKELRNNYEVIGNLFYEIEKEIDEHLAYLQKSLEKMEKNGN